MKKAKAYQKRRHRKSMLRKLVHFLGCLVVFCTTYALILPAITQEKDTFCGMEAHLHNNEQCYIQQPLQQRLSCTEPEVVYHSHTDECYQLQPGHMHDESCYTLQSGELICTLEEAAVHEHGDECFLTMLRCTAAENHVHGDGCYAEPACQTEHIHEDACYGRGALKCTAEEGHTHGDACYTPERLVCENPDEAHSHGAECYAPSELVCSKPENHVHEDACYEMLLLCGQEEHEHSGECSCEPELICTEPQNHTHNDSCYESVLICELPAGEGHAHTSECFEQLRVLSCGLEEAQEEWALVCGIPEEQVHVHTEECYTAVAGEPLCSLPESEEHTHTETCYAVWELACTMEEHVHTLACYADLSADVEEEKDWKRSFRDVELSGNWAEDVLFIAQTQLGYRESKTNYIVLTDGETIRGYTRYGEWYGSEYADWCAMFASFCIHYAEVEGMPLEAGCQTWIEELRQRDLYHEADGYEARKGDLIFFDWDEDGEANHVGFVTEWGEQIATIEGNKDDRVAVSEYSRNDERILGYGAMPVNEELSSIRMTRRFLMKTTSCCTPCRKEPGLNQPQRLRQRPPLSPAPVRRLSRMQRPRLRRRVKIPSH